MSALSKRKRGTEQEDCDPISKGQVKEEDPPAPIKKLKSEGTLPTTRTESVEIVKAETEKRNQAVAFKIAMELLQQLQHQDGTLSAELVDAVEEIMVHTRTVVAFAKRHAPTPFPPTLGLFCIFSSEVLLYLFSYLRPRDLWGVRAVCHVFEGISRDQALWKAFCQRHFSPIHNQLHIRLGKDWEWLYRCKARSFKTKLEIKDGAIGSFVDQSQGMNERYEGEWGTTMSKASFFRNSGRVTSALNGYGMFIDEGNIIYEGNFVWGKLNGTGRQYSNLVNKEYEYNGEFKDGLWHGHGKCVYVDGRTYDGYWEGGARHGMGTMTYPDHRKFVGEWRNGMRNGPGMLYWPSGARYEGPWANDEMKGGGTFYSNDGRDSFSPASLEEAFTILWKEKAKYPDPHRSTALSTSSARMHSFPDNALSSSEMPKTASHDSGSRMESPTPPIVSSTPPTHETSSHMAVQVVSASRGSSRREEKESERGYTDSRHSDRAREKERQYDRPEKQREGDRYRKTISSSTSLHPHSTKDATPSRK